MRKLFQVAFVPVLLGAALFLVLYGAHLYWNSFKSDRFFSILLAFLLSVFLAGRRYDKQKKQAVFLSKSPLIQEGAAIKFEKIYFEQAYGILFFCLFGGLLCLFGIFMISQRYIISGLFPILTGAGFLREVYFRKIRKNEPVLKLGKTGVWVAGSGFMEWKHIQKIRFSVLYLKHRMEIAEIFLKDSDKQKGIRIYLSAIGTPQEIRAYMKTNVKCEEA